MDVHLPGRRIAPGECIRRVPTRQRRTELLLGEDGRRFISAQDYAVALVDEVENGRAVRSAA
ncbi:hypothetical protein [Streptomyces scabiei]|uniref:hypothetical protein n=1 Tax=Streptomyces scabiei TaxID=1930 RepID=UPI0029AD9101|nr:hypothetical protein [Streptomyces scabiei]MDX3517891.1 hypothetical protein [Streptomyces scabiei]